MKENNKPEMTLIEKLHHFQFHNAKGQLAVYLLTISVALAYALINDLLLKRPEHSVVIECAILTVCLQLGLTLIWNSGLISKLAFHAKRHTTAARNAQL
jgi:hypothetical protein